MKRWLLRVSVVLCALAVLGGGSWWVWREWYSTRHLQNAVNDNDADRMCLLIRLGAPVEVDVEVDQSSARPVKGKPLHWAAKYDHPPVVKLLLAKGADPNVKNRNGKMPLDRWPELVEIVKEVENEKAGKKQPGRGRGPTAR